MDKNAQWITNRLMCNLSVFNVFHKEVKNEKSFSNACCISRESIVQIECKISQ